LVLQDSSGQAADISVLVKPAPLLNVFTVTPVSASPGVGCSPAVCSGQDGTATVTLRSFEGAPLAGRQVRFDVVQGQYLFYSDNPAQPFMTTSTVTSDQNGLAIVRFKANVNAVTGAALIRATDLITGNTVNGSFVIAQFTDGTGTLSIIPKEAKISMFYKGDCSSGVPTSFYIFGGTPPYRVVTDFPDGLLISGSPVQTNGGGFIATTRGWCLDPGNVIATDATGRTLAAQIINEDGDEERPTIPVPTPELMVTPPTAALTCGQTATFVISGGVGSTFVAASVSPVLTVTVAGRVLSVTLNAAYVASGAIGTSGIVNVSDGTSIIPVTITYPASCP
jgi:hypothetical protein